MANNVQPQSVPQTPNRSWVAVLVTFLGGVIAGLFVALNDNIESKIKQFWNWLKGV